jgi:hypothetical protein
MTAKETHNDNKQITPYAQVAAKREGFKAKAHVLCSSNIKPGQNPPKV